MLKPLLAFLAVLTTAEVFAQTANDIVPAYNADFGQGINFGWYENWTDDNLARLATGTSDGSVPGIGVNALRPGLFAWFLEQHGYDVRVREFATYGQLGATENVVMLGFPSDGQRGTEEWCAGSRSGLFRGMWDPIWDDNNGTPYNENNTYAAYVYKAVLTYRDNVRFYEVWNEPDINYTGNGWKDRRYEGNWFENEVDPCELNMQAPVRAYVRMLRISYDIIKRLDPDAYVAVGGIGYPSFLDAILRTTDEPMTGAVTPDYPLGGGAYFDALSFHVYPHLEEGFRDWDNDRGRWAWKRHSDAAIAGFESKLRGFETVMAEYGYDGSQFPAKVTLCTESNLPRQHFYEEAAERSTMEMQRNFTLKILAKSQAWGLTQFHPYQLADTRKPGEASGEFDLMGFYGYLNDKPTFNDAVRTGTGVAYATYGKLLRGATVEQQRLDWIQLPQGVDGVAFRLKNGRTGYMLWAKTHEDGNEFPTVVYTPKGDIATDKYRIAEWDFATNGAHRPVEGDITLTGSPIFVLQEQEFGVNTPTTSDVSPEKFAGLGVFPNPATTFVEVRLPASDEAWTLTLTDALGRTTSVQQTNVGAEGGQVRLALSDLPAASYQLEAVSGSTRVVETIVVTKD